VEVCSALLARDPTLPGLHADERYRRSEIVLRRVFETRSRCTAPAGSDAQAAREALSRRRRPASFSDAAESNIALAERLWAEVLNSCKPPPAPDDPVTLLMAKLAKR